MQEANYGKLSSMHFYGWKKGLKTGMYYLRSRGAAEAIKFTVDQTALKAKDKADSAGKPVAEGDFRRKEALEQMVCSLENKEACMSCGA